MKVCGDECERLQSRYNDEIEQNRRLWMLNTELLKLLREKGVEIPKEVYPAMVPKKTKPQTGEAST